MPKAVIGREAEHSGTFANTAANQDCAEEPIGIATFPVTAASPILAKNADRAVAYYRQYRRIPQQYSRRTLYSVVHEHGPWGGSSWR